MIHAYFIDYPNLSLLRAFLRRIRSILLIGILASSSVAQSVSELSPFAEVGSFISSSDRIPFWLRANQWGRVPLAAPTGTARLGFHYQSPRTFADTALKKSRLNWEFSVEGVSNIGTTSKLLLPEAYAKLRWKRWELMAGREQQIIGIVDTTLSSGSYSWSGNALPVPMVKLSLAEYVPLGFLGNFVSIKGSYVHAWFNEPYIKHAYIHQKTLYGRFGKPNGKVHVQLGMVHHVQWGGEAEYLKDGQLSVDGKLTTNLKDYILGVVLAQIPSDKTNDRFTNFDGVNRIGNHVGHYDFAVDWKIRNLKFLAYRQHPFEDASGLQFQNLPDGLYGFSLRRNVASTAFFVWKGIALEYLYTRNQTIVKPGSRFQGGDDYFNHAQYIEGWSYQEKSLGTPFFPTRLEVKESFPTNKYFFLSNKTVLYHVGIEALLAQKVHVQAKISQSYQYGSVTLGLPLPHVAQFSSLLAFDAPLLRWGNTRLKVQLAYDTGGVLAESLGGYVGIKSNLQKK